MEQRITELEKENEVLKEKLKVFEDMKADMCSTKDTELFMYLNTILRRYGEIE